MNKNATKFNVFLDRAKVFVIFLLLLLSFFLVLCGVQNKNIVLGLFAIIVSWQTGMLSFIYITDDKKLRSLEEQKYKIKRYRTESDKTN